MDLQISQGKALLGTKGLAQEPQWCWDKLPYLHLLLPHCLEAPWLSKYSGNPDNFSEQFHPLYDDQPCLPTRHSWNSFCRQDIQVLPKKLRFRGGKKPTQQPRKQPPASSIPSPFPICSFIYFFLFFRILCHFLSSICHQQVKAKADWG